jgi:hypothetical protein
MLLLQNVSWFGRGGCGHGRMAMVDNAVVAIVAVVVVVELHQCGHQSQWGKWGIQEEFGGYWKIF